MSASSAADELARMTSGSKGEGSLPHPEDLLEAKDKQSTYSKSNSTGSVGSNSDIDEIDDIGDSSDDSRKKQSRVTKYIHKKTGSIAPSIRPASSIIETMPQYRLASYGAANTGPKGVLADARSFELAKKREMQARLNTPNGAKETPKAPGVHARLLHEDERIRPIAEGSDDEDDLMALWRKKRLQELKSGANSYNRKKVSSGRKYGRMESVDAAGYLDAIEKVTADTVVVVLIYDDRSSESQFVEDCMGTLARRHVSTRFIKLHYSEAEMDRTVVPALLAYKSGELIVNLPQIIDEIPSGRNLSSESLETVLRMHNALTGGSPMSSSTGLASSATSLYDWDDD